MSSTPQQTAQPSAADVVNKDILELLNAQGLSNEQKQKLYEAMEQNVYTRVVARIADKLSESEMTAFIQLLDKGDRAQAQQFLAQKGFDLPALLAGEAVTYKAELVSLVKPLPSN